MTITRSGRGIFISVEGGEGVGKTLFISLLTELLTAHGKTPVQTREPGGTPAAEQIRGVFASPPTGEALTPLAELFLVSAARAQHVTHKINPALKNGQWVLSDRFLDSTRAYQGELGGLPRPLLETVITASTTGLLPDITFLLDCDEALARKRLSMREGSSASDGPRRYDEASVAFHRKLRAAFLKLAGQEPNRIVILDAAEAPQVVAAKAWAHIKERFQIAPAGKTSQP